MVKPEARSETYCVEILGRAEEILVRSAVDHRFVGGAITNPINLATAVVIDAKEKKSKFHSHGPLTLVRGDDSIRDVDVIGFSPYPETYTEAKRRFEEERVRAKGRDLPYPTVSVEPTHYPNWPARNRILQFVSTIDVDESGRFHLTFGKVDQEIPRETMEAWKVMFQGGLELTSINPFGLRLRYGMRNASGFKKKDLALEFTHEGKPYSRLDVLARITNSVKEQGLAQGIDYEASYQSWQEFIYKLRFHPDPLTRAKALVTKVYWETVGTAMAHGAGILKPFAKLGDKFTG